MDEVLEAIAMGLDEGGVFIMIYLGFCKIDLSCIKDHSKKGIKTRFITYLGLSLSHRSSLLLN